MNDKQKNYKRNLWFIAIGIMCFVVAPMVMFLMTLLALGYMAGVAMFVIGSITIALLPAFNERMYQWKFKALKNEISREPIIAMYRDQQERERIQDEVRLVVRDSVSSLETYAKLHKQMIIDYPDSVEEFTDRFNLYKDRVAYQMDHYVEVRKTVAEAAKTLIRMEREFDMATAAMKLEELIGDQGNFMNKLREKFAMDAVEKRVNDSVAAMRMSVIDKHADAAIKGTTQHAVTFDTRGFMVLGDILAPVEFTPIKEAA